MLLLATVGALTGCRLAEHGRRAAIDAFASFVLDSVLRVQKAAPLTQAPPKMACHSERSEESPAALQGIPRRASPTRNDTVAQLPQPVSRVISVDLTPKAELCRVLRVQAIDIARARVEARMAMAEVRGTRAIRVIIIAPDAPEAPASL